MVDQRQQNERSQVTPEIERRCFICLRLQFCPAKSYRLQFRRK